MHGTTGDVKDEHRSGRKRKTTEREDAVIVSAAEENPFTTPRTKVRFIYVQQAEYLYNVLKMKEIIQNTLN